MSELWETLTTGLIVSLLFIGVSYFFWKRYDKPTPLMIERQEEKDRIKEEQRTWRQVEAKMRAEQEEAELKAAYEQRKAAERERAMVPQATEVSDAWKSLGVSPLDTAPTFEAQGDDANRANRPSDQTDLTEEVADDADLLRVDDLVQVRQDKGVDPTVQEPDWELIDKLHEIAEKDEIEVPDVPEAPDLDSVAGNNEDDASDVNEAQAEDMDIQPTEVNAVDDLATEDSLRASAEEVQSLDSEQVVVQPVDTEQADEQRVDVQEGEEQPVEEHGPPSAAVTPQREADADGVSWGLSEGEDLWAGTSWEEA
jgi:hypothetical protein